MPANDITADWVREQFRYEPETGLFFWRVSKQGRVLGQPIGAKRKSNSYIKVGLGSSGRYWAHRLAWLYVNGNWPKYDIDHINGDRADNRICNLRDATKSQNLANRGATRTNRCGHKGVHRHSNGSFRAQIQVSGRRIHIGLFDSPEQANLAYRKAAAEHFGSFANGGV